MTKDEALAEAGNIKKRAFRDIEKLSRSFLGLLLIADDIAGVGDLEDAAAKAKADLAAAEKELAERMAEVEACKAALAKVEHEYKVTRLARQEQLDIVNRAIEAATAEKDRVLCDMTVHAQEMRAAAGVEAETIVETAHRAAADIRRQAEQNAQSIRSAADGHAATKREELDALKREIAANEQKLVNIRTAIAKFASQ